MFKIYDEIHCEFQDGEYKTFDQALAALNKISEIPWNRYPNVAPCESWKTCGRVYQIIEYVNSEDSPKELSCRNILEISEKEIKWLI